MDDSDEEDQSPRKIQFDGDVEGEEHGVASGNLKPEEEQVRYQSPSPTSEIASQAPSNAK